MIHGQVSTRLGSAFQEGEYADLQHPRSPVFVQQQVGHSHASTTAIYTSVSSDYRTRMLRAALDRSVNQANDEGGKR